MVTRKGFEPLDLRLERGLSHTQLSGPLPQNLTNLNLMNFRFEETDLCEPPDAGFQAWLDSIDDLRSTNVICN